MDISMLMAVDLAASSAMIDAMNKRKYLEKMNETNAVIVDGVVYPKNTLTIKYTTKEK